MEKEFLRRFLSERAIELHKEYIENCRLRLSILGKSGYDIEGKSYPELCRARLGKARDEILSLSREVYLHEMYFDSFCAGGATSDIVKRCYRSVMQLRPAPGYSFHFLPYLISDGLYSSPLSLEHPEHSSQPPWGASPV